MYRNKKIAVVIPCYNEAKQLSKVIDTMPDFVDQMIVIDDKSEDSTIAVAERHIRLDSRIILIKHNTNKGVGAAISTGYIWCRENDIDIAAVMAGDAQMDPDDLANLLDPVVENLTDYAKGNRLSSGEAWSKIPRLRYLGNSAISLLTKIASGYWHVADSQTGYTALNKHGLQTLPLEEIYPRYGMPNDFLVTLNIHNMRVVDVPVKPIYGVGEESGLKIGSLIFTLSLLMVKLFIRRMVQKYIIRDFHPLVLLVFVGLFLLMLNLPLSARLLYIWFDSGTIPKVNALAILFCSSVCLPALMFAMLFDMEANRDLKGHKKKEPS